MTAQNKLLALSWKGLDPGSKAPSYAQPIQDELRRCHPVWLEGSDREGLRLQAGVLRRDDFRRFLVNFAFNRVDSPDRLGTQGSNLCSASDTDAVPWTESCYRWPSDRALRGCDQTDSGPRSGVRTRRDPENDLVWNKGSDCHGSHKVAGC